MSDDRFSHSTYLVRKKLFSLFGSKFHIYGPDGEVVLYSRMKPFKLWEDISLYTGEDMQTEVLSIKARNIIDFAAAYDVMDVISKERIGALKRKGFKSILKDEWIFLDNEGREIGFIKEDSRLLAFLRRFITNIIPQEFHGYIKGTPVCTFKQLFNPFVLKIRADFSGDVNGLLDKRLGIAAAVLLCGIEGRQR
ncbi:MAG TPA: hypothetical protein VNN20_00045 [Thermodesulfobacteriota bacterium]|nr:hypothetical protein [Thermodesulfobacteriota bacterium]